MKNLYLAIVLGSLLSAPVSFAQDPNAAVDDRKSEKNQTLSAEELKKALKPKSKKIYTANCWAKDNGKKSTFSAASLDEGFALRAAGQRCAGRNDERVATEAMGDSDSCECAKAEVKTTCSEAQKKCAEMTYRVMNSGSCGDVGEYCDTIPAREASAHGGAAKANNMPVMPRDNTQVKVRTPEHTIPGSNGDAGGEPRVPAAQEDANQ